MTSQSSLDQPLQAPIRDGEAAIAVVAGTSTRVRASWQWTTVVLWLTLSIIGLVNLARYSALAGPQTDAPRSWPAESALALDKMRPTLVLFFHPHCPCSKATVEQLSRLLAARPDACRTYAVLAQPVEAQAEWSDTALADSLRALPTVQVVTDIAEVETLQFGATTSGTALLFDPEGQLLFEGGITPARGHAGDNWGSTTLLQLLDKSTTESPTALQSGPVYGCPLQTPANKASVENTPVSTQPAGVPACCRKPSLSK